MSLPAKKTERETEENKEMEDNKEKEKKKACDGCGRDDVPLKNCAACGSVWYCGPACQKQGWPGHRAVCRGKKKEKERGSGFADMGSLLNALMPPPKPQTQPQPQPQPQPQRYCEGDVLNACLDGHHEELQKMLRQRGLDVNWAHPEDGSTAASAAAHFGHDKCLTLLSQQRGADMSKAKKDGCAPIHTACQHGRYACIEILLANNRGDANLHVASEIGSTPAMICTFNGHVKCLALLSDKGADLNLATRNGQTAAHVACQTGQFKCLQFLIRRGANINIKDTGGLTPLDFARAYKQRECIHLLVANGGVGRRIEDLPPMSDASKVCMSICAYIIALSD